MPHLKKQRKQAGGEAACVEDRVRIRENARAAPGTEALGWQLAA